MCFYVVYVISIKLSKVTNKVSNFQKYQTMQMEHRCRRCNSKRCKRMPDWQEMEKERRASTPTLCTEKERQVERLEAAEWRMSLVASSEKGKQCGTFLEREFARYHREEEAEKRQQAEKLEEAEWEEEKKTIHMEFKTYHRQEFVKKRHSHKKPHTKIVIYLPLY
jgi:hypothetical protein